MNMFYPVTLKRYRGGQVGAFFADVPEAITAGTNGAEALDRAQDALLVALSGGHPNSPTCDHFKFPLLNV